MFWASGRTIATLIKSYNRTNLNKSNKFVTILYLVINMSKRFLDKDLENLETDD